MDAFFMVLCAVLFAGAVSSDQQVIRYTEQLSSNVKIQRFERDLLLPVLNTTTAATPDTTTKKIITASEDKGKYYSVKYDDNGGDYWRELSDSDPQVVKVPSLQDSHRLAVQVSLGFNFQFYGHALKTVTIATGGFLYMSPFTHTFLTESQYVAPLMADFDTSEGSNSSQILYRLDDDAWIVQWNQVYLKGNATAGPFTFQVQLWKNTGKIVFVYKNVPMIVLDIPENDHPVKVGLSDAYYWDEGNYRVILPYHTVRTEKAFVQSGYAIIYTHLTTCNMLEDCDTCLNGTFADFTCYWCSKLEKCSDGFDRLRQDWVSNLCPHDIEQEFCDQMMPGNNLAAIGEGTDADDSAWKVAVAAVCTFLGVSAAVILIALIYGYRNPQSSLGQFVIKNRPSELRQRFKTWQSKGDQEANGLSHIG